jgi:hypothetical protein
MFVHLRGSWGARSLCAGAAAALLAGSALGQQAPLTEQQAASGQFKVHDQGSNIQPAAQAHFDAAAKAAGADFKGGLLLCNAARPEGFKLPLPTSAQLKAVGAVPSQPPQPAKVFDNLYYLGTEEVTS